MCHAPSASNNPSGVLVSYMPKNRRLRFLQALVDAGPDLSARFLSVSRNNAALQVSDQLQVDDPVARCECVHTRNAREVAVQGKRAEIGRASCRERVCKLVAV